MAQAATTSQLPPKDAGTFKRILKCYEQKQYKQGLKLCRQILSQPTLANHGETLSMKGLILNAMDKKTEAYESARLGLRNDLKSHVCWHVLGLIYRSDKNYAEAIKCYRNALKFDKDNLQILRDFSLLQIQMRDLAGFANTRHVIFSSRSKQRVSWIGYAVAEHVLGNVKTAAEILGAYEKILESSGESGEDANVDDFEATELALYHTELLIEAKDYAGALAYLDKHEKRVVDSIALWEARGKLFLETKNLEGAAQVFHSLLLRNQENKDYFLGYELANGLGEGTPEDARLAFYEKLLQEFPQSHTARRLPLLFTTGATFERLVDSYLRSNIRKGVVPLYRNIRSFYSSPEKTAIIDRLLHSYLDSLQTTQKFSSTDPTAKIETPATLLWVYFILAQHLDKHGRGPEALAMLDKAIAHTPTLIDLYLAKAKVLKHGGNPQEAAKVIDTARELDTADRYLNSKAVKYYLRAGNIARAEELAAMFTREAGDPIGQLSDMQCMWFETEEAIAFLRKGQVGKALKKLHAVHSHLEQMIDDQFDFHSYCLRKLTLRSYVRLLRLEDRLEGHKFFTRAALIAVDVYLGLHDVPFTTAADTKENSQFDGLSEEEKKKLISKQRKAAKRAEAQATAKEETKAEGDKDKDNKDNKDKDKNKKPDADPEGLLLAQTAAPLDEALKLLRGQQLLAADNIDVHFAAFEIYSRKNKPLLMLQSLNRAARLNANHPRLHAQRVRFLNTVGASLATLNPKVAEVIRSELPGQFGTITSPKEFNAKFLEQHKGSFAHTLAAAEMTVYLDPSTASSAVALLANPSGDLPTCTKALESLIKTFKAPDDVVAKFRVACRALYPLAAAFAEDDA